MVWAKVSSIEKVGEEQVYDIEIEGTHNFIGNDIVAHNTFISGNAGIATTTPSRKLSIYNSATADMNLVTDSANLLLQQSGANSIIGNSSASGYLQLFTNNGNAYVTMLSNGSVGIATTTPGYPLTVNGVIYSVTGASDSPTIPSKPPPLPAVLKRSTPPMSRPASSVPTPRRATLNSSTITPPPM